MAKSANHNRGDLFRRVCIALTNVGVLAPARPNVSNLLDAIRRARGHAKPTQVIQIGEGIELIEAWLAEVEARPKMPEHANSWRARPELKFSLEMREAIARCRQST